MHIFKIILAFMQVVNVIANLKVELALEKSEEACRIKTSCSKCIQTSDCKWCKDVLLQKESKRCFFNSSQSKCDKSDIVDPKSEKPVIKENESIRPSEVFVKLRTGKSNKVNISMEYIDEKDRPLDLYILMDLSCTMDNHKKTVEKLASELAKNLSSLTKDLRMGFGSFVDKPMSPYAHGRTNKTVNCLGRTAPYIVPHLFINHLSLTKAISNFEKAVSKAKILTNSDAPEGGLDALMQVISCKNELGWRYGNKTRRLIVVCTDGLFHIAGDGKLGGIMLPNDEKCHLDKNGTYDKATELDYPSVSQIRNKIKQENVYVIFAVANYKSIYEKLVNAIGHGFSSVQNINEKNSSIPKIIEAEYKKVVSKAEFDIPWNNFVDVTYYATCPGSNIYKKTAKCDLKFGSAINLQVELTLKKCPSNSNVTKTNILIKPIHSDGESHLLNITVEFICDCDCELQKNPQTSENCNNKGILECGICKCQDGWIGEACNCSLKNGQIIDKEKCQDNNSRICSNRGACLCGTCKCNEGYTGDKCECGNDNDNDCILHEEDDKGICNNKLGQGKCCMNTCKCNEGFNGTRCQCPTSDSKCRDPISVDKICNNFGDCNCGKCDCQNSYYGEYCTMKHAKLNGICNESLKTQAVSCLKCYAVGAKKIDDDPVRLQRCASPCANIKAVFVDRNLLVPTQEECQEIVENESNCVRSFILESHNLTSNQINIRAEDKWNCPEISADLFPIIMGIVGGVLLIGLVSIFAWKVSIHIKDKKEYENFQKELGEDWHFTSNMNPEYVPCVQTFQNPIHSENL